MDISNLTNYSNMHMHPSYVKQMLELKRQTSKQSNKLASDLEQFMVYQKITLVLFLLLVSAPSEDQNFIYGR